VVTGTQQFAFDGHDASVYSVYPHIKENIHVRPTLDALTDSGNI
jgi:hypothetical protein